MTGIPQIAAGGRFRFAGAIFGSLLAGVAAVSAYWQLFTTFRFWDDEGYVLLSLRNFAAGGALYAEVFSQYGPAYNLLYAGLNRGFGMPLDTASARWLTLAAWVAATLLAALLVRRVAGSRGWAVAAGAAVFVVLRLLTHEPLHPVGLISLLLVGGTAAAVLALLAGHRQSAFIALGVTGATLALVKINVGLFYLAGAGIFTLWQSSGPPARQSWARGAVIAIMVLAGVALMYPLAGHTWVRTFILVYAFAAATTLSVLAMELHGHLPLRRALPPFALAALLTLGLMAGAAWLAGVQPRQLWEGVVRAPLRHPASFHYAFSWARLTFPVLALNAVAFGAYRFLRARRDARSDWLVAVCRLAIGGGLVVSFYHAFAVSVENYLLAFGPGFLWCLVAPLGGGSRERHDARGLLGLLALCQILHAYPVAGTQVNIGTVLLAVLIIVGLAEVAAWVREQTGAVASTALTTVCVALALWGGGRLTLEAGRAYARNPAETFTGAQLHLSPWQTSTLAALVRNFQAHGDVLFSLPGLFSFNLWSNRSTPTRQNVTHWWSLLDEPAQATIATRLGAAVRPVVLIQRNLITAGLAKDHFRPSLLTRYITERFIRVFSLDSYELWMRRDAAAPAIGIGEWHEDATGSWFEFNWPASPAPPPTHIEWVDFQQGAVHRLPMNAVGLTACGPASPELKQWQCRLSQPPPLARDRTDAARFIADNGDVLMEVRFPRGAPQMNPR